MSFTLKSIRGIKPRQLAIELYHLCIALLPVLYIINVPGLNISLGTVILLGFVPHSLVYILKGALKHNRIKPFVFLMLYIYMILRSEGDITRITLCVCAFLILYGQMKGAIDNTRFRRIIEGFAMINVALVIVQVISYYGLHIRIQYVPKELIYEEYQTAYVFREFTGLYRPSGLFLEPSHFSQYCLFAMISALFPEAGKARMKKAVAIGIGCILTTSGMGIALTFGVFGWYMFLNRQNMNRKVWNIIRWIPVLVVVLVILSRTEFFQTAMDRIFSSVEGYNAISGRTHNWDDAIGTMRGEKIWFGYGASKNYDLYLTGLADTIYKYGVICVVLEGMCFLYLMLKKVDNFVWCCCVVFGVLFCVAHITNLVSQVFYFGIVIADAGIPKKRLIHHG